MGSFSLETHRGSRAGRALPVSQEPEGLWGLRGDRGAAYNVERHEPSTLHLQAAAGPVLNLKAQVPWFQILERYIRLVSFTEFPSVCVSWGWPPDGHISAPTWQAARRKLDSLSVSTLGTATASDGSLLSLPKESQKTTRWALSSHARGHRSHAR